VVVLVAEDAPEPDGLDAVREVARSVEVVRTSTELGTALADGADVLAVYDFRTPHVADHADAVANLGWVHAASAGVDAVLVPSVIDADTVVTNAQGVFDDAIAEYVLGLLIAFAKELPRTLVLQREREWRHRETERIAGRRVLVVGAGSIGGAIGRLCRAVGMDVRGLARTARDGGAAFESVAAIDDLHHHLGWADDVVIATPLTPATRHLIDSDALSAMRRGARLVNIGRGPVVDQDALVEALRSGQVGAAGLDVFETEPLPAEHPFWGMDQVVVSPHMSGDVVGWVAALGVQFAQNLRRWRDGEPLQHVVDKRALAGAIR
jgi:phosphoglycerate dehydrogenase-like enzyme